MAARPSDLPDFGRPPIDEVAITLQFRERAAGYTDAHAGLYWQTDKDAYSRVELHPRVAPIMETLEESAPASRTFQIELPVQPLGGRTWLVGRNDDYVVQIQNDRFIRNWRKREGGWVDVLNR